MKPYIDMHGRAGLGDALSSPTAEVCHLLKAGRLGDEQLSTRTSLSQLQALMCGTPEPGLYQQSVRKWPTRALSFLRGPILLAQLADKISLTDTF